MKRFDFDWLTFLDTIDAWDGVPEEDRWTFLEMEYYVQSCVPETFNAAYEKEKQVSLIDDDVPTGKRINPRMKTFWKCMRDFFAIPYFPDMTGGGMQIREYLGEVFTRRELAEFCGPTANRYAPYESGVDEQLRSPEWIQQFLDCEDGQQWEQAHLMYDETPYFVSNSSFELAQQLVKQLMEEVEPVLIRRLQVHDAEASQALLSEVLRGCVRYALVIPTLDGETLDPQIGLWPDIVRIINRPPAPPPSSVQPINTFHAATLMDDMTSVLVECTTDKVRLRANDHEIFKRHRERIEESFSPFPEWVIRLLEEPVADRMGKAVAHLKQADFVEVKGVRGQNLRLEATEVGRDWLKLSSKDRLKDLLDEMRGETSESDPYSGLYGGLSLIPGWSHVDSEMLDAIAEAFQDTEEQGFVRYGEFIRHASRENNPFLDRSDSELRGVGGSYRHIGRQWTREQREEAYARCLNSLLAHRLSNLGGITIGMDDDWQFLFALEDPGRYLLGLIDDFEYGAEANAEILIQPNFDITFLAPSPTAESAIGRFAERAGHGVGVLFKITRDSVFKAAASGMESRQALKTLRKTSSQPVPENVEREMKGWFARCHHLTAREALLVNCPDRETAVRLISAAGKDASRLTDTVVELPRGKKKNKVLRKLREEGLFVE